MSATSKEFSNIITDYEFFVRHSTEAARVRSALAGKLGALDRGASGLNVADFGCGDGTFLSGLLDECPTFIVKRLLLVDVVESYLTSASQRLEWRVRGPVEARPALLASDRASCDLIISNHALYYVPDIQAAVVDIARSLKANGLFLAVLASNKNSLIDFWKVHFGSLGKKVPYFLNEDLRAALRVAELDPCVSEIESELKFVDTAENRTRIARFLVGNSFSESTKDSMLSHFDQYRRGPNVVMPLVDELFSVSVPG